MMVEMGHPVEGTARGLGIPIKLSETAGCIRRAAPLLGEYAAEVLAEAGLSAEELAALRERTVVA